MDQTELETLRADVEELKRAVKRNNPFLREVVSNRFFSAASISLGFFVVAFCAGTQILIAQRGSFSAVPAEWKLAAWIILGLFFVVIGPVKWIFFSRKAQSVEEGANFFTVIRAVYEGSWLHLYLPGVICMLLVPVFAIFAGHPWYIVPGVAIFIALPCNSLGFMVQRSEYLALGWYSLIAGLSSLFFMEAMPFVWSGIIYGGALLVFGIVGLVAQSRRRGSPV
jgi:hypothetical protein